MMKVCILKLSQVWSGPYGHPVTSSVYFRWPIPRGYVFLWMACEASKMFPCGFWRFVVTTLLGLSIKAGLQSSWEWSIVYIYIIYTHSIVNISPSSLLQRPPGTIKVEHSAYHQPIDVSQVPIRPNHCLLAGSRFPRWHWKIETGSKHQLHSVGF